MNARSRAPAAGARRFQRARLPGVVAAILFAPAVASAGNESPDDVEFDAAFLPVGRPRAWTCSGSRRKTTLRPVPTGDVRLNGQWQARADIVYREVDGVSRLCLDPAALKRYGIAPERLHADQARLPALAWPDEPFCGDLGERVPGATASFDAGSQTLDLQVPQLYLRSEARGHVDPSEWDAGVAALSLGYNANVYRYSNGATPTYSGFLGLNASGRVAGWQLVHQGAMTRGGSQPQRYRSAAAYLMHDIVPWKAQLMVGDTSTAGDLFESVRLRGARRSDDRMLPQSQRGFAPVVRGIAETNARVIVRQRGNVLLETSVAPGPFEINDLFPTGYAGDLDVEVVEADGRSRRFTLPYSAVPQLLRPGQSRWSVAAGRVAEASLLDAPDVLQLQYQRGLSNVVSAYGGAVVGDNYHSVLAGSAVNTRFGALAMDASLSQARVNGLPELSGSSFAWPTIEASPAPAPRLPSRPTAMQRVAT